MTVATDNHHRRLLLVCCAFTAWLLFASSASQAQESAASSPADLQIEKSFAKTVRPLLQKHCDGCHGAETMEAGIRLDRLDGKLQEPHWRLWEGIKSQLEDEVMPPEDEPHPTPAQREELVRWISRALMTARSRPRELNGSIRRLTVSQYRNTLRELLGLQDDLTDVLPPDGVSKDGFVNNEQTMLLSPLLLEGYFEIARKALDKSIVDEQQIPKIQTFRMDLGAAVNPDPCPDKLILGALSRLLENQDFLVTQLTPEKPFEYEPFFMRTKYRFIEGYQGNDTVRGWREYDSIYHAVFACMRGTDGYPKGNPYDVIQDGLLLRPAIPSAELFQVESTYGPKSNFKISLRELPDVGRFRVTVKAARYEDALLLEPGTAARPETGDERIAKDPADKTTVHLVHSGVYQVDVHLRSAETDSIEPNSDRLQEKLLGHWPLDGNIETPSIPTAGRLEGAAEFNESPFGQALAVDGQTGYAVIPRHELMNVSDGEFTVACWIRPTQVRQGGIVCLGGYGYTHGWLFDMPDDKGILRIETANPGYMHNGTVQSRPGVLRVNQWQHVAAVVKRGENQTRLYVNGYEVASGTIQAEDLDNPKVDLHIGRIQGANLFAGQIDEVRLYQRALEVAELQALVEPGKQFAQAPRLKNHRSYS